MVLCGVFGVTGSSTLFFVRPALKSCGIEGTLVEGPNSFRVISVLTVSPIYTVILLTIGTLAGRHSFFAKQAVKMMGRFGLRKENIACGPALQKK